MTSHTAFNHFNRILGTQGSSRERGVLCCLAGVQEASQGRVNFSLRS